MYQRADVVIVGERVILDRKALLLLPHDHLLIWFSFFSYLGYRCYLPVYFITRLCRDHVEQPPDPCCLQSVTMGLFRYYYRHWLHCLSKEQVEHWRETVLSVALWSDVRCSISNPSERKLVYQCSMYLTVDTPFFIAPLLWLQNVFGLSWKLQQVFPKNSLTWVPIQVSTIYYQLLDLYLHWCLFLYSLDPLCLVLWSSLREPYQPQVW